MTIKIKKFPKTTLREKIKEVFEKITKDVSFVQDHPFGAMEAVKLDVLALLDVEEQKREEWRVDTAEKLKEIEEGKNPFDFTPDYLTLHKFVDLLLEALE